MSLRSIRSGATAITEAGVLQFITDLVYLSGVFDILAGQFAVTAGTGLAVNIATGRAYLVNSGGNTYPVINDATISNLAINSNGSGNPRITSIVLYKNVSASPNSDDSNTVFCVAIDGTAAASPTPPNNTQITAVTGSNPYIVISNVRVNSGATAPTSIDNTVIPQVVFRTDIFNNDRWITYNPAASSTLTLDLAQGKKFQVNLPNGTVTLALVNVPKNPKSILIRFTQPSSGTGLINWFTTGVWDNGVTPSLTATVNKSDEFEVNFLNVTNDSTNTWEGAQTHQNQ